jgi:hypothetical protein
LSEIEDPVATVLRLINSLIRVAKDNGEVAKVVATEQALDREILLKEYDAQITVALDPNSGVQDQKLNLSGSLRRQQYLFKCTAHCIDKPAIPGADLGKVMRNKVTKQIKDIIRENRTLPYQTTYNFYGLGYPEGDPHKAFSTGASLELTPSNGLWAELSASEYQGIWASDDLRCSKSVSVTDEFALMLFRFKIGSRKQCVKRLALSFEGYGTSPVGNGLTVKIWNSGTGAWQNTQIGTQSQDETLTITLTANLPDFIDDNGYVWLLARTTNPSDGTTPASLYCNFVQLIVWVYGITYCDILSYRVVDVVDVKPFIFKTEFVLKGYAFETISR